MQTSRTSLTTALDSAQSEIERLTRELEDVEQSKQVAMKESFERNESQIASLNAAHRELDQRLRDELDAALKAKASLEKELSDRAESTAATETAKRNAEALSESLQSQLDALSTQRAELEQRLVKREEELVAELDAAKHEATAQAARFAQLGEAASDHAHDEVDKLKSEVERLEFELGAVKNELTSATSTAKADIARLTDELASASAARDAVAETAHPEEDGSSESASAFEAMRRDMTRLESELAAALAELAELESPRESESSDTEAIREFTTALDSAQSEIERLTRELEDVEQSKQVAMKESFERNESQIASLNAAHRELDQRLRDELDAALKAKASLEKELSDRAESTAATETAKRNAEALSESLQSQLDALSTQRAELEQRLVKREEELVAELDAAKHEATAQAARFAQLGEAASDHAHDEVDKLKSEVERLEFELGAVKNELTSATSTAKADIARLTDELASASAARDAVAETAHPEEDGSSESASAFEAMRRDMTRLESELAAALAELAELESPRESESSDTEAIREFTTALDSAQSEIERLTRELEDVEQSKQVAMKESFERNESQIASLNAAHRELDQRLRDELDAALKAKASLEKELSDRAESTAATETAKRNAEALSESLQSQLDALSTQRAELEQRLVKREEELVAELDAAKHEATAQAARFAQLGEAASDHAHDEVDKLKSEVERLEFELGAVKNELTSATSTAKADIARLTDELASASAARDAVAETAHPEEDGSSESASAFEAMRRDMTRLESELAAALAELAELESPRESESSDTEAIREFTTALDSAQSEIERLTRELEDVEQSKQVAMKESFERNESQIASLNAAHRELDQRLRDELDAALKAKASLEKELSDRAESTAATETAKRNAEALSESLQSQLDASRAEEAKLRDELNHFQELAREEISALHNEITEIKFTSQESQASLGESPWPSITISTLAGLNEMMSRGSEFGSEGLDWLEHAAHEVQALEKSVLDATAELELRENEYEQTIAQLQDSVRDAETDLNSQKSLASAALSDVEHLNDKLAERDEELASLRLELANLVSDDVTRELELTISNLRIQLTAKDNELNGAVASLNDVENDKRAIEEAMSELQAAADMQAARVQTSIEQISSLNVELAKRSAALDASWDNLSQAESRARFAEQERDDVRRLFEERLAVKERALREAQGDVEHLRQTVRNLQDKLKAHRYARSETEAGHPEEDGSSESASAFEAMRRDMTRLESELAAALAELAELESPRESESSDTEAIREFTTALDSAQSEIERLTRELEDVEQSKQVAMKESFERNESQIASLNAAHRELDQRLRDELDAALKAKASLEKELSDRAESTAAPHGASGDEELHRQLRSALTALEESEAKRMELVLEIEELQNTEEMRQVQTKYETAQASLAEALELKVSLEQEHATTMAKLELARSRISELESAQSTTSTDTMELKAQLTNISASLNEKEVELQKSSQDLSVLRNERDSLQNELRRLQVEYVNVSSADDAALTRATELRLELDKNIHERDLLSSRITDLEEQRAAVSSRRRRASRETRG